MLLGLDQPSPGQMGEPGRRGEKNRGKDEDGVGREEIKKGRAGRERS